MDENNLEENSDNGARNNKSTCNESVKDQENNAIMDNKEAMELNDVDIVKNITVTKDLNHDSNTTITSPANNMKPEENGMEHETNTKTEKCENIIDENQTITDEDTPKIKPEEDKDEIKVDVKIDTTIDCEDVTQNVSDDKKVYKKYQLRQRQNKSYAEEKPPSKKKKVNNKDAERKIDLACHECYLSFETKTGYSIHMSHHNQPEKFTCAQCSAEFLTNKELKDHKKGHNDEDRTFTCGQCKVAYSSNMEYLVHKAEHKTKDFECEECGKMYLKNHILAYRDHLQSHFNETHKCDVCQKVIKNRHSYLQHLQTHEAGYSKKASFLCGECGKECKNKSYYEYHMSSHTGVKRYQCLYCGKGFANAGQRNIHTRIHTNTRPYECTMCNQKFVQTTDLQRHIKSKHTSERFICAICKKEYKQKSFLAFHMRMHTKKDLIPCPDCDEKFILEANLKVHYVHRHMEVKPFKCDICKVAFKLVGDLRKHLNTRLHKNNAYGVEFKRKKLEETN